jgi:hypothetical protein
MTSLNSEYRAEIDAVSGEAWPAVVAGFADASLFQVWAEAEGQDVSRMLLKRNGDIVAAAEVRLFTVPVMRGGIAYVFWGPLWRRRTGPRDPEVFRLAVRALIREYVDRREMVLRINPRCLTDDQDLLRILADEGFSDLPRDESRRSLVMDLTKPLPELRADLDKKWRNCLSKAERSGLELASGTSLELFDEFVGVYEQMLERKQFAPTADIAKHRRIQTRLPEPLKMGIVLARVESAVAAGAIYSTFGDTALYLFGATADAGMRTSASYLVQWTVVQELIARGVSGYDLNGINAETNPGTYHFKKGLAGKSAPDVTFASPVQIRHASLTNQSILLLDQFRTRMRARRARSATPAPSA